MRVIPASSLGSSLAQMLDMDRKARSTSRDGAQRIWAGTVTIRRDAKTGAHHYSEIKSVIYVARGKARMRWDEKLEFVAAANPSDFIFAPHQEIIASTDEPLECVVIRSDDEAVVVISISNRQRGRRRSSADSIRSVGE